MTDRLTARSALPSGVEVPGYRPEAHGVGIVHIGPGAFFRAHQAVYTDTALARGGGDWRIAALSLRSPGTVETLAAQDGRYALFADGGDAPAPPRVIASIAEAHHAPDRAAAVALLARPGVRIVTLTITEKGYGLAGGASAPDPDGVPALLVQALRTRRERGDPPFACLSCDNLAENGATLKRALLAQARDDEADWIAADVPCPSTMVDRITPAPTEATLARAVETLGLRDGAAVATEAFSMWAIEDDLPFGHPAWDAAGALIVPDVSAHERMKLRMLNGAHSFLAYAGVLAGLETVADAVADADLRTLARAQMQAAADTLGPVPGVALDAYADQLIVRFANPALRHRLLQIAEDGSQKLPQRVLSPAVETLVQGGDIAPFARAIAVWMAFCRHRARAGETIRDPLSGDLAAAAGADDAATLYDRLAPHLDAPAPLRNERRWRSAVVACLDALQSGGVAALRGLAALRHD